MFLEWIETAQPRRGNGRGVREGGGGEHGNENERWVGLAAEVAVVAMAAIVVLQVCFSENGLEFGMVKREREKIGFENDFVIFQCFPGLTISEF